MLSKENINASKVSESHPRDLDYKPLTGEAIILYNMKQLKIIFEEQEEIWKDIEGYEGLYQISNMGRIKSLPRKNGSYIRNYELIIRLQKDKNLYSSITLWKSGMAKTWKIHRLVAIHFLPNPNNLKEVNHINGIKSDNRCTELEWINHANNIQHSFSVLKRIGTWKNRTGENNPSSKKVAQICLKSGKVIEKFDSIRRAAKKTGANLTGISLVCNGKNKHCKGFKWSYL